MPVSVKICGLTGQADAAVAAEAGADFLGFVFFPASRRCLALRDAVWIRGLSGVPRVGVFRDQPPAFVAAVRDAAGLERVQLHGAEDPEMCAAMGGRASVIKAISVGETVDWRRVAEYAEVATVLFDTASPTGGGTGRRFDWRTLDGRPSHLRFWLAGGLDPASVGGAILALRPDGVDVATGVEVEVGRKDPAKIRAFIAAVRGVGMAGTGGTFEPQP